MFAIYLFWVFCKPPPPTLSMSPLMWTLINSSQGQMGRRMQALFSPPLKLPSGGNIITFINNSGGFTVSISWFRHFWIRNKNRIAVITNHLISHSAGTKGK